MKDKNGKQAAIRAGYSPGSAEVTASRLLSIVNIQEKISEFQKELETRLKNEAFVNEEMIMQELKSLGFANIDDFVSYDNEGVNLIPSKDLPRSKLAAVKGVKMKNTRYGTDVEFDLYDKGAALIKMGEQIGMFKSKMEITGKDGKALFEKMEDAALQAKIDQLLSIVKNTAK
jgi:phage terminase small subunit